MKGLDRLAGFLYKSGNDGLLSLKPARETGAGFFVGAI